MKYLILFLLLLPLSLIGQVESQFNGTLNVFSASRIGFTNTFTISGIFSSTTTSYTSANSAIGDIVQVQSGSRFYWMHIYSIASNSGGVITCNVRDSSSTLTTFPSGKWSIFRPTTNLRLPLSPDGETNASRSATFNTLALKVDEIQTSVASATNCEITLTKNNHGFSKWTPLYWTGSTFVRPTYDTLVPDYIVVDSLTANTFVVATCGTYPTTLSDGIYWYTNESPGYSLTQDTTKAALFQVIDSTLILNPIVGFNLMASGADALADTAAAIRADFPTGITDDDYGDITVSSTGTVFTVDNEVITGAKIASQTIDSSNVKNRSTTLLKLASSGASNGQAPLFNSTSGNWEATDIPSVVNPKWLYVSKATGNNSTAQKGNAQKPYADPFAAADEAVLGDEIFVLDGIWWYGVGGDFDPYDTPGLLRDGITWHFSRGVKFKTFYDETQYNDDTLGLLYTTAQVNCKILGNLVIEGDYSDPTKPSAFYDYIVGLNSGENSNIEIELDSLLFVDFSNRYTTTSLKGNIELKVSYTNSYGYGLITKNCNGNIRLSNYGGYVIVAQENSKLNIKLNNVNSDYTTSARITADTLATVFVDSDNNTWLLGNGVIHLNQTNGFFTNNTNTGNIYANLTNVDLGGVADGRSALYCTDNNNLIITCKGCYTSDSIYIRISPSTIARNPRLQISGDIDLRGGSLFIVNDQIGDFPDFKGIIFKDLLFLNSNPSKLILKLDPTSYTLGSVFINCWANISTTPILGITQHGEPISTY